MTYILYFRQDMVCLLQPEFNFLHRFFRCKLPVEVVDVEVMITSMQGTHIFRRDRTTQLIKCTPWSTRLHPHPTIIKKMKTFLEVESKMGPIPTSSSQFRPLLPDTNPNIRKDKVTEKRKRATPKKFRPATSKPTAAWPTLPEAPPKPKNDAPLPLVPAQGSTPQSGTGKMSGNLFQDRNWLLPPNYLENKTKNDSKAATNITSPKPQIKEEECNKNEQPTEKCGWGPGCPFCKSPEQKEDQGKEQQQKLSPNAKQQAVRPKTLNLYIFKAKQQWEEELERLNSKYNLDFCSDSELGSESDEGEQYHYEHSYETLI